MQGIEAYEANADTVSLEQFIHEHRTLVKKIALHIKRRLPSHIELEDLLQSGFVGLLEARKHYDSSMGATFDTFASIRIHGSIMDSLRKNSWCTRELSKNMRMIGDAVNKLEQRHLRQASNEEIAAELGVTVEEYLEMCQQVNLCNVMNLDLFENDNSLSSEESENPQTITQDEQTQERIKKIISFLPEREQLVLSLYYIEEFTFKQIGEILDLTEARISQLHTHAISKIQTRLGRDPLSFSV